MKKKLVVGFIILFLVAIVIYSLSQNNNPGGARGTGSSSAIGVIDIQGTISNGSSVSVLEVSGAGAQEIMATIREARERDDIKAVVLRINSPGGTPAASQEIGIELDRLRESKPVVTSMGDVCASGGYWLACSTDHIVASGSTITGSIGVIMELTNLEQLYKKVGVNMETIKSGEHKDIGSPSREITEEERALLQEVIDDSYEQFLSQVQKGREGKIDNAKLREIADGRIFTGRQAQKIGLVDSLGDYYDAIEIAKKKAGINKEVSIEILNQQSFWEKLAMTSQLEDLLGYSNYYNLK